MPNFFNYVQQIFPGGAKIFLGGASPPPPGYGPASHYGGAKSLRVRRMAAGSAEKSQQCHKYFLEYSTFASERPQFRTVGRQTCFLPLAPCNLVTPLAISRKIAFLVFWINT